MRGALAADPTTASSQTEVGQEEERFRRRERPLLPPDVPPPLIDDRTTLPTEPPSELAEQAFLVRRIELEPNPLVSADEVRALIEPLEGRTLTLADLRALTTQLTQRLRRDGYVTSRAYLPPQEVTDGAVTVRILEGRIGQIRPEGATRFAPERLMQRMRARPGALLHYRMLQRDLAQLNANPDRSVTAVLLPGDAPGTTDVILRVSERWPLHVGYLSHNAGTAVTGRIRQGVRAGMSDLTGRDDQLVVRAEWSERSQFSAAMANYLLPLGKPGRTLGVDVSRADVTLGGHFRRRTAAGNATVISLTWAEPLWQREAWELEWATGVDWKRIRARELASSQGKDDLRVFRLGPNVIEEDATGRSILTTEVGIGFDGVLGGSHKVDPSASRLDSGGQFTRVTLAGGRLQRLPGGWQVVARGSSQLTNGRLPPAEGLRLGGEDTVRGYPEGEILGDYGYAGSLELRYPLPVRLGAAQSTLTPLGFVDAGATSLRKPVLGEDTKRRLVGIGFGCRWSFSLHTAALVDVGWPIGDDSIEGNSPRLYYAITVGF